MIQLEFDFGYKYKIINVTSEELNRYFESQQMNDDTLPKSSLINQTLTNNSQFNAEEKFDTLVINNGRSPATNLVLQLSYPQGKILDY